MAAIAGVMGAKALGMFGKTPVGSSGVVGKTPEFRKSFVKDKVAVMPKAKPTAKTFPRLKVDSTGNVFKDGVNKGVGNVKTKFINRDPNVGSIGIYQGGKKVSGLNQKAINILKDGKIQTGGKTYADKSAYRKAMDVKRAATKKTGFSKSTNKKNPGLFGFTFDKPLFKKGTMVKARGGGMARTKPTKMY